MRTRLLILVALVSWASNSALAASYQQFAASYQRIDGTTVGPIQNVSGGNHPYFGINLEPDADLDSADLAYADLDFADLSEADLDSANLSFASLRLSLIHI